MRDELKQKKCIPCESTQDPFDAEKIKIYMPALNMEWKVIDGKKIRLEYLCRNFKHAIELVNKIAEIAEKEGHHPDLFVYDYKKLAVELFTHNIGGLSENDFIEAVKIEELLGA
jgi:4a-hydroxytetrahydrobiopterin dehydratase